MSIHSQLPYDQSTSHARIPAGGINLIASIDSVSEAQFTASFFGSTKALHGEVATTSPATSTHNHSNQQYSITAVTTSTGTIAERYAYTAYGEPTICDGSGSTLSNSSISNRYSYTGREWDATVGLYHFRARWLSPKSGRFLGRDPIGYEGSPYAMYEFVYAASLSLVDPTGEVGGTIHHGYPLHLGGLMNQPVFSLWSVQQHQAAHNYLASHGFGFGDPGRLAWSQLTPEMQAHHIRQALLAAGVPSNVIDDYIDDVLKGAKPGIKTPRVGSCGPRICWSVGFSAALIVLTSPSTAQAAELDPKRDCTRCFCKTFSEVEVVPSWWNISPWPVSGSSNSITPWIDIGSIGPDDCRKAGSTKIVSVENVPGYTLINSERTDCEPGYAGAESPFSHPVQSR
ncbi:MAG: RHS repeat domain-containing protein [Pirellula sp.]